MTRIRHIDFSNPRRAKLAALATMFTAAACGGGGGGGGGDAPPPPPADPTVSAMFVNPAALGSSQELMVTITGADLGQGLSLSSAQCASLTRSDVAPASTAATAYYRCVVTPGAPALTVVQVAAARSKDSLALGTASFTIGATTAVVTAIAGEGAQPPDENGLGAIPGEAKYSQLMTLRVDGSNVNQGVIFDSPVCTGMELSTSPPLISTDSTAYYRCRVTAVNLSLNQLAVKLASAPAVELITPQFNVPAPQVTLSMVTVNPANQDKTPLGSIVVTLRPDSAPIAVNNFLGYVNSGFYDGTIFDNVQKSLTTPTLIQGGRFMPTTGTPPPTLKAASAANAPELPVGPNSYVKWSVAMGRNTAPADGPAQFVINTADNLGGNSLSSASAVFGSVTAGQAFAETIGASCNGLAVCLPIPNFTIEQAVQTR